MVISNNASYSLLNFNLIILLWNHGQANILDAKKTILTWILFFLYGRYVILHWQLASLLLHLVLHWEMISYPSYIFHFSCVQNHLRRNHHHPPLLLHLRFQLLQYHHILLQMIGKYLQWLCDIFWLNPEYAQLLLSMVLSCYRSIKV